MRLNFVEDTKNSITHYLPLLIAISAALVLSICLWLADSRVAKRQQELNMLQWSLAAARDNALYEQQLLLLDSQQREQQYFISAIRNEQRSISQAISHILSWLPDDVVLTGLQADEQGGIVMNGAGLSLTSLAQFLRDIALDNMYSIHTVSPFIYQRNSVQYSFSVQVVRRQVHDRGGVDSAINEADGTSP